jgi:hypothetical protein
MNKLPINEIKAFVPRPEQLSRARELLGWSITTASENAALPVEQVRNLETDPRGGDGLIALEATYKAAGIAFAMFSGLSGQIYKTRLRDGEWSHVTVRGPLRMKINEAHNDN